LKNKLNYIKSYLKIFNLEIKKTYRKPRYRKNLLMVAETNKPFQEFNFTDSNKLRK